MGIGFQVVLRLDPLVLAKARQRAQMAGYTMPDYLRFLVVRNLGLLVDLEPPEEKEKEVRR